MCKSTSIGKSKHTHVYCGFSLKSDKHLTELAPCLVTWIGMMSDRKGWDGADGSAKDAPWWYNERASLSHFAGAIWQNGGWVTEEFILRWRESSDVVKHGRCDISFEIGDLKVIAEAKQAWPWITNPSCYAKKVKDKLEGARREIRSREASNMYEKYAIVIASPYVTESKAVEDKVSKFVDAIINIHEVDAVAWAFPLMQSPIQSPVNPRHYFPGVALVISRVQ